MWPFRSKRSTSVQNVTGSERGLHVVWPEQDSSTITTIDLIAIHGLGAHWPTTWERSEHYPPRKSDRRVNWLCDEDMLPSKIPEARILRYDWDGNYCQDASTDTNLGQAANLLESIVYLRQNDKNNDEVGGSSDTVQSNHSDMEPGRSRTAQRPIIFIASCFGGLVLAEAAIYAATHGNRYHDILNSIVGILFLGTPFRGSFASGAAKWPILYNQLLGQETSRLQIQILERKTRLLEDLLRKFSEIAREPWLNLPIVCAYETKPTQILKAVLPSWSLPKGKNILVTQESAVIDTYPAFSMNVPHSLMNKFSDAEDSNFRKVVSTVRSFIERKDEILLQRKGNLVVEEMRSKPAFVVPFLRDPNFVGRKDIFGNDILDRITKRHEPAALQYHTRVALYGLGGVGKSQIAIEYAYRYRELYPNASIFWVNASGPPRFKASYEAIAKILKLPGFDDPKTDHLDLVFQWLLSGTSGPWLMILDNIDDLRFVQPEDGSEFTPGYEFAMARYLPQRADGAILITTRDKTAAFSLLDQSVAFDPRDQENPMVHLLGMHEDEAKALLDKQILSGRGTDDEKFELIRVLEYLPLAITQAAAYIRKRDSMTVSKYLEFLLDSENSKSSPLRKGISDHRRYQDVPNSILMTWQITFKQIRETDRAAAALLSLICMFDRQSIPRFLFQEDFPTNELNEAIETLLGYSIIYAEIGAEMFDMHRLVQLATKEWLRLHGDLEKQTEAAVSVLAESYPFGKYENWQTCQMLEPHAEMVLRYKFESESGMLSRSFLQHNRAWYFMQQGHYSQAEDLCASAVEVYRRICGEDHSYTLASMSNLAQTYIGQGRFDKAEGFLLALIDTKKRVLGEENPETLVDMSRLSDVYWSQGNYKEAETSEVFVLEVRKRVFSENHPSTLASMHTLASLYVDQGRFEQAEELLVALIETRKRVLGENYPETLTSMHNLASLYWRQGRLEQAEELQVAILETRKRVLGENHPDTLTSINNLASIYADQGRLEQAEELLVAVLESRKRVLGGNHPETLTSMHNLASLYWRQGRLEQAEELQVAVLKTRKRILSENHPDTLTSMHNLASIHANQGQLQEAEELYLNLIERRGRVLGKDHPGTILSMANLAITYKLQKRDLEASELMAQAVHLYTRVLGPEHPSTKECSADLQAWQLEDGFSESEGE